ncbi:MAG TPA: 2Fe-2S iron-sulfur cluster-binding protein, partial [Bacteroidales bacterium]|nr:2Fe-2S iron-sulfur cluster-binding protein [Bacteroidales bacterium]
MDITTIITVAVLAILIVTLILVAMLLYAKAKLTPSGKVKITINGEKELSVSPGSSLLTTLSNEKIFLPSACGGSGTCGMCKCRVIKGGGEILPTETGFFTRKQQKNNWRLGCQVKVKE